MYDVLSGVKVVELSSWLFVPSAGAVLADWGAEVVKIEHPRTGDPVRGLVNAETAAAIVNPNIELPNRGKRSIGVDIATERGRAVLDRLVDSADVFLTNFLPAARQHLSIDVEHIRARNPNVVYALGTGQGSLGPEADRGGFDLASAWARAGAAFQMTPDGGEPPNQPGSFGDLSGGLTLAGAVAAALYRRQRDGHAPVVEVSLYSIGMWWMAQAISAGAVGVSREFRTRRNPFNPLVNYFPTKDGRWICLVFLQADRWFPDLCDHIGRPDLLNDPRFATAEARIEHVDAFTRSLDEIFVSRPLTEWRHALARAKGVWAPVLSPAEIANDPQALANGYLPEIDKGDGRVYRGVASPVRFDQRAIGRLCGAPEHGQDTEVVLEELGFDWDEIVALKECGAVL
ncbi:MAG: CoA transferase [Acidimicrobiales bacterium]|jgi:crotonobetainyl-CoA:carnitine CoA-transferase CaiB-like acyl-CoA transferase|nr:CoA transferase [Acidimicrobiales bacterium]